MILSSHRPKVRVTFPHPASGITISKIVVSSHLNRAPADWAEDVRATFIEIVQSMKGIHGSEHEFQRFRVNLDDLMTSRDIIPIFPCNVVLPILSSASGTPRSTDFDCPELTMELRSKSSIELELSDLHHTWECPITYL